jgi:hypothetical protein
VVVAGAETTGLVTVVGGALGCGAGVWAEVMEAPKAIATRAIRVEMMRMFMRMILPAGSTASNKKRRRDTPSYQLSGLGGAGCFNLEKQALLLAIARRMSQKFRSQASPARVALEFRLMPGLNQKIVRIRR